MASYEIPLSPEPQTFTVDLAGVSYRFNLRWNAFGNVWVLDILNGNDDTPILTSLPLVADTDLLEPYPYLNFGGKLIAHVDSSGNPPSYSNLGIAGKLYFITP